LNNDLGSIFVSQSNQGIFEPIIETIEHFARDSSEHQDAKLALSVITRMCSVWGGADILDPMTNAADPAPFLPGFDQFMITRFSALTWSIMTSPQFDPKNPQANRLMGEIAELQKMILAKTGRTYLTWLRDNEMSGFGLSPEVIDNYLKKMVTQDKKAFKNSACEFLQSARSGRA
jgi:exportin-T